jgi:hypothetical protein
LGNVRDQAPTHIPFRPPPPHEEFDDPADPERPVRVRVRKADGIRENYAKPKRA